MSFPTFDGSVKAEHTGIFINNEFVNSVSGKTFDTINPATGQLICKVQEGDKADVDKAVEAAREAFKPGSPWRLMSSSNRGILINKLADLIEKNTAELASLEVQDNGKPFKNAVGDVMFAVCQLRYYAGYSDKIHGKVLPCGGTHFAYTRREPVGICAAINPWNFPMVLLAIKLGPCLACGNVIVVKPAEQTPLTTLRIGQLVKEAGFPAGVINIVPGYGPTAGAALSDHMDVNKIAFTGSTEVGKIVQIAAAKSNLKRVSLELGGKSPNIIFADAGDIDQLAKAAQSAAYVNMGQTCCAGTRTFVQDTIYEEFVKKSVEHASKITVGDPTGDVDHGPQIDEEQFDKILGLIEKGKKEGAVLHCGGQRHGDNGYFVQPTVFSDVKDTMTIAKEEIFGPVQSIMKFSSIDEVITRANKTDYGLAAAVYTKDMNTAIQVSNGLAAGTVWVNCYMPQTGALVPFGGFKQSGIGREGGEAGLVEYYEEKSVVMKTDSPSYL